MPFLKKFLVVILLSLTFSFLGFTQKKVKYKDLFPILLSKDYQKAEPLLIQYLGDNQDEANPHFYMGEILTAKLDSTSIFPTSNVYDSLANKAINSYKKAIPLVDDREVKKNDEYYIAYNRRDLRTGKFGIKIADIHLDYENKISALNEKLVLIDQIHQQKSKADELLSKLNNRIDSLRLQFPNEKAFLLRSTPKDFDVVRNINKTYAEAKTAIDEYFKLLTKVKSGEELPHLRNETLDEWSMLKPQSINLFEKEIHLKDYQSYLSLLLIKIEDEIIPFKTLLLQTDEAVNSMFAENQFVEDSSQIIEVTIPENLKEQLVKLNAGALPLKVLSFKKLKNEAQFLQNTSLYPVLKDSSNVFQNVKLLERQKIAFQEMDQLLALIEKFASEENTLNYHFYLKHFDPSFEGYLSTEKALTENQLFKLAEHYNHQKALSQVFIYKSDSIFNDSVTAKQNKSQSFAIELHEKSDFLIMGGQISSSPFVAKARFDMKIEKLQVLPDSAMFVNLIQVNDKILLNTALNRKSNHFKISSFNQQIESLWSIEFQSDLPVVSAKEEAGILFLYNVDGEVITTLDSKGNEIGN